MCPSASFLATVGFKFLLFHNACMVFKHAVVAAFLFSVVKMLLKGEVGGHALNSHRKYIVDHGKSWKNHGIVFLNLCGSLVLIWGFQTYAFTLYNQLGWKRSQFIHPLI